MTKLLHWDHALTLVKTAMANGAAMVSPARCLWHSHGDCESPFVRIVIGRPSAETNPYWEWKPGRRASLHLEHWLRCNNCERCLRHRARLWARRISYEVENAPRTWFGTLTMNPAWHWKCELQARKNRLDFDHLDDRTRLKECLAVSGLEVTRYLKRLRKHATAPVRFVCVTELHEGGGEHHGKPHYHLLIHEQTRGALLHKVLANQWTWGFEKWRLIEPGTKPAWYLCKYLTKSNVDRVRASVRYGNPKEQSD